MDDKTYIPYTGAALPGNAEVVILFSSTAMFGKKAAVHYGCFWFDVAIQASQGGSLLLQRSIDGGVNYVNAGTSIVVAAGNSVNSFFVSPYADWRVVFTNGATPQTQFIVEMVIDHQSRGSLAQA